MGAEGEKTELQPDARKMTELGIEEEVQGAAEEPSKERLPRSRGNAVRLSANVHSKFFPLYHFFCHIINISPPKFSSPAAVPPILSPYTPLQL
jgi:hypothetical protein